MQKTGPDERRTFALACTTLLFACCLALAWKVVSLRSHLDWTQKGVSTAGLSQLVKEPLAISGKKLRITGLGQRRVAMTIFTPGDCPPALRDVGRFDFGGITGFARIGIMSYASIDEVVQTKKNLGLNFPIVADSDGLWLRRLSPPQTPWQVLLDLETHLILRQAEIRPRPTAIADSALWSIGMDVEERGRR